MLSRSNRLTSGEQFKSTIRAGAKAGSRTLVLHWCPADQGSPQAPRVGFVVSKSLGNAVVRNLVRRRLRHLMRPRLALLPGPGALVVRALPAAAAADVTELDADLGRCLTRVLERRAA
jgi:ribonuclease P protein component